MSIKVSILETATVRDMDGPYVFTRQARNAPLLRSRQRYSLSQLILTGCAGFFLYYLLEAAFVSTSIVQSLPPLLDTSVLPPTTVLTRPENVKIIGLMFYGRAQFTNILEWLE